MWNQLRLFFEAHTGFFLFLVALSTACAIYLVAQRRKVGEWAWPGAAGAGLLIFGLSIYKGVRIIVGCFEAMAISGAGGPGAVGAALAESRGSVLAGDMSSSIVMLAAFASYRVFSYDDSPGISTDKGSHLAAFGSTISCIVLAGLLIALDHSLPELIMNSVAGTKGLSLSTTAQSISFQIFKLSAISIVAMITSTGMLIFPILLNSSKTASTGISMKISSSLVLVLLLIHIGIVSRQGNFFYQIAVSGTYPGTQSLQKPLTRQERMRMLPDSPGTLDLAEPIRSGDREMVRELIRRGANPNDDSDVFLGQTPLMYAIHEGQSEIALDLIQAGADINARGSIGKTPLMQAALSDRPVILKLLLEAGADPNVRDENGSTALTNAVSMGSTEGVQLLLQHGADPNSMDSYGISALQVAEASGRKDIIDLLIKAGAK